MRYGSVGASDAKPERCLIWITFENFTGPDNFFVFHTESLINVVRLMATFIDSEANPEDVYESEILLQKCAISERITVFFTWSAVMRLLPGKSCSCEKSRAKVHPDGRH
jgi:hypothetical protein